MCFHLLRQTDKNQEPKRIIILSYPLLTKSLVTKTGSGKMILQVRAEYVEMLHPLTCSSHTTATMEPPGEAWKKLAPSTFSHSSNFICFVVLL